MNMKKTVLTLGAIAASGAYGIREAAVRSAWLGTASPVAIAVRDPLLAPSSVAAPSSPQLLGAAPAPGVTSGAPAQSYVAAATPPSEPAAAAPPAGRIPQPTPLDALPAQAIENAPVVRPSITTASAPVIVPPKPTLAPPAPPPAPAPGTKAPGALFRDGSFTGSRFDAYWGTVQVRAVIKDGKLASVDVLDYPSDRRTSQQINRYVLPILQREVVQAQGVRVNIISGATLTGIAYLNSLRSALTLAQ